MKNVLNCFISAIGSIQRDYEQAQIYIGNIICAEKIEWAIYSFDDIKSPELDGRVPKMLTT